MNIDLIDEAINNGKKISFDYNSYGVDKKLHLRKSHIVSPYQMIIRNQHYFLMANDVKFEDVGFYHLDKISNIKILDEIAKPIKEIKGYEKGINYKEVINSRPYMFSDPVKKVSILCDKRLINELIDWFGFGFEIKEIDDEKIKVTLRVSIESMVYWCLQYGDMIEVIDPKELRDKILNTAKNLVNKYEKE